MTLLNNQVRTNVNRGVRSGYSRMPGAVWDISPASRPSGRASRVRTLHELSRTDDRQYVVREGRAESVRERIERRRERAHNLTLGVVLGFSLIVGAALGGVFTEDTAGEQSRVDQTAEVTIHGAR